jgi:hypothetical protein
VASYLGDNSVAVARSGILPPGPLVGAGDGDADIQLFDPVTTSPPRD